MAEVERDELWNGEANIDDVKPMKVSIDYDENFEEGDLIRQIGRTFIDYAGKAKHIFILTPRLSGGTFVSQRL